MPNDRTPLIDNRKLEAATRWLLCYAYADTAKRLNGQLGKQLADAGLSTAELALLRMLFQQRSAYSTLREALEASNA